MYNCYTHGWSHLLNPCPMCFQTTTSSGTTHHLNQALVGVDATHYNNLKLLAEHYEFLLTAAENLHKPNEPIIQGLAPMFYHTLTYEGDLELIEKTKQARKAYEKWLSKL